MSKSKSGTPEDPLKRLADSLREKKGVPWGVGKLELDDGEGTYVEFFRGKDFARYFRADPAKLEAALPGGKAGRGVEDQIRELMHLLLHRRLVIKTERKFKKPKPGRKRLVKFPKTLCLVQDQSWDEDYFYAWQYDRPTSVWYYVGTVALPVIVILACLFPLAPWWMRMAFIYLLMTLLAALLAIITLRYCLFGAVWMATGHYFWLFPNLMSDEVSVLDAFRPALSFSRYEKGKSQWKQRAVTALLSGAVFYVLYVHSPNIDHLKEEAKSFHDSVLEYLDVYGRGKTYLHGNVTEPANATAGGASGAAGAGAGAGQQQQQQQGAQGARQGGQGQQQQQGGQRQGGQQQGRRGSDL